MEALGRMNDISYVATPHMFALTTRHIIDVTLQECMDWNWIYLTTDESTGEIKSEPHAVTRLTVTG